MSWPDKNPTLDVDLAALDAYLDKAGVKHFSAKEITHLNSARAGEPVHAVPPADLWPNIRLTLLAADAIRAKYGAPVVVVSGYRPPKYNERVGGEPASYHMRFGALDIRPAKGCGTAEAYDAFAAICEDCCVALANAVGGDVHTGVGRYPSPGKRWVHIDVGVRPARARWER